MTLTAPYAAAATWPRTYHYTGQQLKERAQLGGWVHDGSAEGIAGLCDFGA